MAVAAVGHSSVVGELAAHQSTAHQRRATRLAHLRASRSERASTVARLSLPLVAPSNDEHGSTVRASNSDGAQRNTRDLGLLTGRRAATRVVFKHIATTAARCRGAAGATSRLSRGRSISAIAERDANGGVDLLCDVVGQGVWILVQSGVRQPDVQSQGIDQAVGVRHNSNGSDEAVLIFSVERLESSHLDKGVIGDLALVDQGLGNAREQLSSRLGV